jgi:hypothetical protein
MVHLQHACYAKAEPVACPGHGCCPVDITTYARYSFKDKYYSNEETEVNSCYVRRNKVNDNSITSST